MAEQVVLVLTQRFDPTADLVIRELHSRRVPLARVDSAEFPEMLSMRAVIGPGHPRWDGVLTTEHRAVRLSEIRSVWYRRPSQFALHPELSRSERVWAEREARAGFGGVLGALRCRWVNHPHRIRIAESKPRQLCLAAESGLMVPPTLVTNDPGAARSFVAAQPGGAVYKPLSGPPEPVQGQALALYTSPVALPEITDGVRRCAHLFQARIPKRFEVRLVVVGTALFAARIDATSERARMDWRSDYASLTYQPITIPESVAAGVRRVMKSLGLVYAAWDFIVDPQGCWHFIEINPNGQWGWIELATGLPIASALADLLEGHTS